MRFSKSTPGFDGPQHLVARPEYALEQLELLGEQLEHALVGLVLLIQEVDNHHIVLLSVAVAAADALLDALGIPRQVVVHDQGAELQVDAFRPRFGGDHDVALFPEVVHEGGAHVRRARAGDPVGALRGAAAMRRRSARERSSLLEPLNRTMPSR